MNPLKKLGELGQALWLDDMRRDFMVGGDLKRLILDDGLRGMTSNPTILDKAISGSADYDSDIHNLALAGRSVDEIYETLSIADVQMAADIFRPLYEQSGGNHGYVSLEVNPNFAHDTDNTLANARHLWKTLNRPNTYIKVPGTPAGLPAIQQLISEGINVNVTLLFGLPRYLEVAEAYIAGIEERHARGQGIGQLRSVASFFLSRIDVLVDPMLQQICEEDGKNTALASSLLGQTAIASAKQAYQIYQCLIASERWKKLADAGASSQWLLWASTSTKNPDYSDLMYVEPLIGPETVNTMPLATMDAYRDHGSPRVRLEEDIDDSRHVLEGLGLLDIDLDQVTQQLTDEGIDKFSASLDSLLKTLREKVARIDGTSARAFASSAPAST